MNSVILQIASKYIKWLLVFFALVALYRGHNYPGGGFIGGLLVGLSIIFQSFAYNARSASNSLKIRPESYLALGVMLILISVIPGVFVEGTFMSGVWGSLDLPLLGELKQGTPFLFDIGVFLAVIGVTLMFFFSLNTIAKWK